MPSTQRSSRVRQQCRVRAQESEGEPDWDKELQVFKQRTLKPNQLEVQRKIAAANVDVGRVRQAASGGCRRRRCCRRRRRCCRRRRRCQPAAT